MNAPAEPSILQPLRLGQGKGLIEGLAFRYRPDRPLLVQNLNLCIEHGQAIAILTRRLAVERSETPSFPV